MRYYKNILYLPLLFLVIFIFFELFGLSKIINKKYFLQNNDLLEEGYYLGKIKTDPYSIFKIQYLHPYYFNFHLWDNQKILNFNKNSEIIKLNDEGFRINPLNNEENHNKILLSGGSTAFGMYASNQKSIISAQITDKLKVNVFNLNSNFGNSHNELISILKFENDYDLSISLTIANDIENFCSNNANIKSSIFDLPKGFNSWNKFIEGAKPLKISQFNFQQKFTIFFSSIFRDNFNLINNFFNLKKNNSFINCSNNKDKIVESFLNNQIEMSNLARMRGAKHITIIQPIHFIHENIESSYINAEKKIFFQKVISKVLSSKYCKNQCYDLSRVFDNQKKLIRFDNSKNIEISNLFYDEYNLLDDGNELMSNKIIELIKINKYIKNE